LSILNTRGALAIGVLILVFCLLIFSLH